MTKRSTKHSLIMSALALLLCCSMLIGSTFAWFTDSVTSAGNKIQSGTLDVDLFMLDKGTAWTEITTSQESIYTYENWEPGYTDAKVFRIENNGTLALKWVAKFATDGAVGALADVIDVYVKEGVTDYPDTRDLTGYDRVGTLNEFLNNITATTNGVLGAGDEAYLSIILKMQETAGNEYQDKSVVVGGSEAFDIRIYATQLTAEDDSFGDDYDNLATYEDGIYVIPAVTDTVAVDTTSNTFTRSYEDGKLVISGYSEEDNVTVDFKHTNEDKINATASGISVLSYDITVTNYTPGTKVTLEIFVGTGLHDILLYHDGVLVDAADYSYDETSGYLTFTTESFSTFDIAYANIITTAEEFYAVIENGHSAVVLGSNILIDRTINFASDFTVYGNGYTVARAEGFTGTMFNVKANATLTVDNAVVDGGAVWTGEKHATLLRGTTNAGVVATGNIIGTESNGKIVLNNNTAIQNNDAVNAISLATRGGGSLTVNNSKILNNTSAAGAIWGGGNIIINDGSVLSGNHATSIGGVVRTVDGQNGRVVKFTMNGGKIINNYSSTTGGVIWSGNNLDVYFNGGEVAYNSAASAGGVIWGGSADRYYISGDFEMHHNTAGELGNAFRLNHYKYPSLTMTGGKVYANTSAATPYAFYFINDTVSLTGGTIVDDILYTGGVGLTIGEVEIDGVVHFDLSTNHNTAYLAKEFNTIKFTVNEEASNFSLFNFKPADDYVYTEGDENKLVCLNEGYTMVWNAEKNLFTIQAQ